MSLSSLLCMTLYSFNSCCTCPFLASLQLEMNWKWSQALPRCHRTASLMFSKTRDWLQVIRKPPWKTFQAEGQKARLPVKGWDDSAIQKAEVRARQKRRKGRRTWKYQQYKRSPTSLALQQLGNLADANAGALLQAASFEPTRLNYSIMIQWS